MTHGAACRPYSNQDCWPAVAGQKRPGQLGPMRGGRHRTWGWGLWLRSRGCGGGQDSPILSGWDCAASHSCTKVLLTQKQCKLENGQNDSPTRQGRTERAAAWPLQEKSTGAQIVARRGGAAAAIEPPATGASVCDGFAGDRSAWGRTSKPPLTSTTQFQPLLVWNKSAVVEKEIFPLLPRAAPAPDGQQETGNWRLCLRGSLT